MIVGSVFCAAVMNAVTTTLCFGSVIVTLKQIVVVHG